jgi:halogenation protein CepH
VNAGGAEQFDVVVIGGGPAGSTASALVAMRGHRVLLLEKESFPRYQIGESLLPSTVHGVCRVLGVADEVARAGFKRKRGGTFRWGRGAEPWQFSFALSPRLAEPTSHAYQVERAVFDRILLDNARRVGVEVREQASVIRLISDEARVRGAVYRDVRGDTHEVLARHVIDASGNGSRVHTHVGGARTYSDFFRNLAVFGYFHGGQRLPKPNDGNIFCAATEHGWLWYIPLRDDLTSVGAVVGPEHTAAIQADPHDMWRRMIAASPEVRAMLAGVPEATEAPYDRVRVRKDYSYAKRSFWVPGMALVGDAACFVDPVLSSGVHLATYSALLAARSINSDLDGTVAEDRAFAEFEARYRREYQLFYEFLISFYDLNQDERSYFWRAKRVTDVPGDELQAFVELVGGLASGDKVLPSEARDTDTADAGARLAAAAADFGAAVERLPDAGDRRNPLFDSQTVRSVFQEGAVLQELGVFGSPPQDERPMRDGGLVAAKDGLSWVTPRS